MITGDCGSSDVLNCTGSCPLMNAGWSQCSLYKAELDPSLANKEGVMNSVAGRDLQQVKDQARVRQG